MFHDYVVVTCCQGSSVPIYQWGGAKNQISAIRRVFLSVVRSGNPFLIHLSIILIYINSQNTACTFSIRCHSSRYFIVVLVFDILMSVHHNIITNYSQQDATFLEFIYFYFTCFKRFHRPPSGVMCSWWWAEETPETYRASVKINKFKKRCILLALICNVIGNPLLITTNYSIVKKEYIFSLRFMYLWRSLLVALVRLDFHNCFRMFLTTAKPLLLYRIACGYFQRVTSVFFCTYLPPRPCFGLKSWLLLVEWNAVVCVLTIRQAILSTAESFIVKHFGEPKGPAACIFCRNNDKIIYRPINFVTWASFL
jgi:hypothetical protein